MWNAERLDKRLEQYHENLGHEFAATAILDGFVRMYEGLDYWNPITDKPSKALQPEQREQMRGRFINHFGFDITDYIADSEKTVAKYVAMVKRIKS